MSLMALASVSCSEKAGPKLLVLDNPEPLAATAQWELFSASVRDLTVLGDELLVFPTKVDVAIVIDRYTGEEKGKWGQRGKGPGEFKQAHYCNGPEAGDDFWLFDTGLMKLRRYAVGNNAEDLMLAEEIDYATPSFADPVCVLKNRFVAANVTMSADGYVSPLVLMDLEGNILKSIGLLPDESHSQVKTVNKGQLVDYRSYGSRLSCYGNHFVQAMTEFGYLAFFDVDDQGNVSVKAEYCLEPVLYTDNNTLDRKQLKYGFIDVKMTADYVVCSYCGKNIDQERLSESLLVFDHKGTLLHHYLLDKQIGSIAVSPDGKTVYAESENPEVGIAVYHLPF